MNYINNLLTNACNLKALKDLTKARDKKYLITWLNDVFKHEKYLLKVNDTKRIDERVLINAGFQKVLSGTLIKKNLTVTE